jgi:hypothetical protein
LPRLAGHPLLAESRGRRVLAGWASDWPKSKFKSGGCGAQMVERHNSCRARYSVLFGQSVLADLGSATNCTIPSTKIQAILPPPPNLPPPMRGQETSVQQTFINVLRFYRE